jgi:diguanylate cyclase
MIFLIDLVFAAVVAAAGMLGGLWLRGRPARSEANQDDERRRAREVLGRLQDLATNMAEHVGQHSSRVEEINQELTSSDAPESENVLTAVTKLIDANEYMRQQLTSAEEKLHEQARLVEAHAAEARTDALTGLANRRAFDDDLARRFAEFQRYGRPFALILADIDLFKRFNDTHGHQAGDEVLRGVARVLRRTARDTDLVARYGGEEFAVLLPETGAGEATLAARRIREAVEAARFRYQTAELRVTISLGAAELLPGEDSGTLVRRADTALYASKEAGRNRGHWHDGQAMHPIIEQPNQATEAPAASVEPKASPAKPAARQTTKPPAAEPAKPSNSNVPHAEPAASASGQHEHPKALATHDEFCAMLARRLAEWRRGGAAPSLLLFRIDRLPEIVNRWGREANDLVLRATSQFLTAAIREMDMAAEYEPGTFAMLLPGAGLSAVIGIAERLRQAISRCALPVRGGPLQFTISIAGTVTIKSDEVGTLVHRAEEALEAATGAGGNCSFFHNGQWPETVGAALERAQAVAT